MSVGGVLVVTVRVHERTRNGQPGLLRCLRRLRRQHCLKTTVCVGPRRQHFLVPTLFVGRPRCQHLPVATTFLDESEGHGLRSPCGSLVPMLFVGRLRRQYLLVATEGVHSTLSLVMAELALSKSVVAALSLGECRPPLTGILVPQSCEGGLVVLAPCCLAGEPDVEAATTEPQEYCPCGLGEKHVAAGGRLLASASGSRPSCTSQRRVGDVQPPMGKSEQQPPPGERKLLAAGSRRLASVSSLLGEASSLLVEELLAASSLVVEELLAASRLAGTSIVLVEEL
jgi:hypothetical protein